MKLELNTSTMRVSRRAPFRPSWLAFRSALAVTLVIGIVAPANAQGPPQKRDCGNLPQGDNESKGSKINARMDCRTENVNVELSKLVDTACNSDLYSASAKKALENARDHAHRARERTKEAGGFKGLGRKQKSDCYLQEADPILPGHEGNGDGVCTTRGGARETCAEVKGDGIGDDNGLCETTGNRKEVCVEICDAALNDQDDDNFDDGTAADVELAFMDLESALMDTNQEIAAAVKAYAVAKQLRQTGSAGEEYCLQDTLGLSTLVTAALAQGKAVAEFAFDLCSTVCGNDVAGFNCKAGCAGPAAAKFVLAVLVNLSDQLEEVATKSGAEIRYSCQGQTSNDIAAVDSAVAAIDAKASNTEAKVMEIERKVDVLNVRLGEVLELLNTPPGRRPDFPK